MGELLFLFALADVAFVGGSLVPTGGHNLLEPAALGKPVLTGPHLFNFLDIAAQLRDAGALAEVSTAPELASTVEAFWVDPARAEQARSAGLTVLKNNQGALGPFAAGDWVLYSVSRVSGCLANAPGRPKLSASEIVVFRQARCGPDDPWCFFRLNVAVARPAMPITRCAPGGRNSRTDLAAGSQCPGRSRFSDNAADLPGRPG
jgi:hypothetical protein